MKKTLSLIAIAGSILLTSQANAKDGPYIGANLLVSKTQYKYYDPSNSPTVGGNVLEVDGRGFGAGISAGYKKSFGQVFVAPEVFYDYLNASTKDYYYQVSPYHQDTLELRSRYGAKANVGYDFNQRFSAYVNYGYANVNYVNRWPSSDNSESGNRFTAIYGLGGIFYLNDTWSIKAELNQQKFKIPTTGDGVSSKVKLNTLQVGLNYSF